ncbi:LD-carboxypeptidase [Dysgonomonas sp. 520]|uniref:S66 peptidase family protein n=1 Tax=Dysgonomonas sp. 520 TaxID=2302931 RepID=UPI0013D7E7E5|nr:LD-carboxypeptidase [Dysgonomonas sp. 520]NDW10895.1 LD-carboxypeptidase [Dysgonomonas sp. 520]
MSDYIVPPKLKAGDKAIIVSPSGNIGALYLHQAKSVLESWGLIVEIAPHAENDYGRYAGTVEQRLSDLQNAMDAEDVRLIFCSRGGYGVVQLLENINFEKVRLHPKWLVGYSDITALHLAFLSQKIISLHAPMARHLSENPSDQASLYLRETMFEGRHRYEVMPHSQNVEGDVTGRLFGGNLAVLSALTGTPYLSLPENGILFIEDIAESPYKIDRMMWNLRLSGILSKIKGLIVGQFSECEEDPSMRKTMCESILEMTKDYNYPVVFNFPVGHVKENYPLMQGAMYKLKVDAGNVHLRSV